MNKRTSKALLLIAFVVAAFSFSCIAAPCIASAEDTTIFYAKDNSKLEQFKARVFNGLIDCAATIDVGDIGITANEVTFKAANGNTLTGVSALAGIVRSHVIFSTYCVGWSGFNFEYTGSVIAKVSVTYDQYNWGTTITGAFKSSYADFIGGLPVDASDFRKVAYIHDWICNHVSYSMNDAYKPSSAIGAIANGKAVCAGYSYAFQFLCQQLGLECSYIYDDPVTVQHAWNKVKVSGQWFYVDTTWDDGTIVGTAATYKYFLLNDTEFEAANNSAHGPSSAWQNASPINTTYYFANKYWQDKQVPLSSGAWDEDPQLSGGATTHTHTWGEWKTTKAATCTQAGTEEHTCSTCGKTETRSVKALGHAMSSWTTTTKATCTTAGKQTRKCTRSGCTYSESKTLAATGHKWDSGKVTKSATCAAAGTKTYTCSRCGATKTESIAKTNKHTWGEWKTTKAPTHSQQGSKERSCSVCGAKETQAIAKLGTISWTRLWGDSRYDTMKAISSAGWSSASTVIVASAANFPDALAASSLAGAKSCPILLTDPGSLSSQTSSQIKSLGATKVYIVGGSAAISANVESQIKRLGCTTQRLAGSTRQDTALKVASELGSAHGDTCIIATGKSFADALSISPYAYAKRSPIYLTEGDGTLSASTLSAIKQAGFSKAVIVGGTSVVSGKAESQLKQIGLSNQTRLGGAQRYETSSKIASWCLSQGMSVANVGVASGDNFPDALAGGALCGKNNSVIVLANNSDHSCITGLISSNKANITKGYVFGGEAAVSKGVWNSLPRS